jgi:hypothetical protein
LVIFLKGTRDWNNVKAASSQFRGRGPCNPFNPIHTAKRLRFASSMNKVMCECGAFYAPVKAKNQLGRTIPFKCILCNRELPQTAGLHIPNYRLIWRPDGDKE